MLYLKQVLRKVIIQTYSKPLSVIIDVQDTSVCEMGEFYRTIASFYDNQLAFQVIRDSFF